MARHDLPGRHVAGLETAGAEPVDLHARHRLVVARLQHCGARDIGALLAHRIDAAHDHVVKPGGVEAVAVADGPQGLRRKLERRHFMQRAVLLAASARRADGIVDVAVGHDGVLRARGCGSRIQA